MKYYESSMIKAVVSLYPEHPWRPWKFERCPRNFFDDLDNVRMVITCLSEDLGIKTLDDWHEITVHRLSSIGVQTMLDKHGGLMALLAKIYPDHDFNTTNKRQYVGSKTQQQLFKIVQDFFPSTSDIHINYFSDLRFADSKKSIQFDVFVPSLSLAIEYQGKQHFHSEYHLSEKEQSELRARRDNKDHMSI
eukprot:TRINITY_DN9863_c0_g1_i2.p1 TRINITY_DN9863_c0_g1~~TRINITY_DN9863_c0_g1_i2.p1  ORF type:complete len:208 (-),score=38.57 TRINITY_DN9863_c0_g1_i2:86-658(-)